MRPELYRYLVRTASACGPGCLGSTGSKAGSGTADPSPARARSEERDDGRAPLARDTAKKARPDKRAEWADGLTLSGLYGLAVLPRTKER